MSNPWVVEPEEVKIELAWDDPRGISREFWIKVKKRLSIGESRRMLKSISRVRSELRRDVKGTQNAEAQFEWTEYSFARAEAFLLDWSLADDNNTKMKINRENIEALDSGVFDILDNAIDQHESKATEEKKPKTGKRRRKTTSP
jgi:vacuolar-type H+-ATPase subunit D/Vma8